MPWGFLGVAEVSANRGNALAISVEKESITTREVSGAGKSEVGCAKRAMRCERVGAEKCVSFSRISDKFSTSKLLSAFGCVDFKISRKREPGIG